MDMRFANGSQQLILQESTAVAKMSAAENTGWVSD